MRLNSHKTVIQIIADAIDAWRKPLLKKREDVADDIVRAHHDTGGVERMGGAVALPLSAVEIGQVVGAYGSPLARFELDACVLAMDREYLAEV